MNTSKYCFLNSDLTWWLVQVVHPIHDQTFYLNERHKRQLKEEFGKNFFVVLLLFNLVRLIGDLLLQKLNHGHLSNAMVRLCSFLLDARIK